ncbi:hypothetical protein PBY51_021062 [Eleginops maclovinus]|uniref:Sushi domain-containing protein n=1 Tax=Eleginops maclovinus TaxID=56733 RepID=A0AAN7XF81_ELEMC|nr:hypothetical protein PBY51_021062 [Eleginops maclovinus]
MSMGYLGFVLLLWFPGVLHAQSETQPCPAPGLSGGYLVPEQDSYPHETTLTYACDNGLKPAVEGWWATSRCQNGNWFPTPQCIDEKACLPTILPNANYDASTKGWYDETTKIWVRCDAGYEHKDRVTTAKCTDGTWSSMPICEKSDEACGEPPKIPHAVVIHQEYQELFEADTKETGLKAQHATEDLILDMVEPQWKEQVGDTLHPLAVGRILQVETEDLILDMVEPQWKEQVGDTLHPLAVGQILQVETEDLILDMTDTQSEEQVGGSRQEESPTVEHTQAF